MCWYTSINVSKRCWYLSLNVSHNVSYSYLAILRVWYSVMIVNNCVVQQGYPSETREIKPASKHLIIRREDTKGILNVPPRKWQQGPDGSSVTIAGIGALSDVIGSSSGKQMSHRECGTFFRQHLLDIGYRGVCTVIENDMISKQQCEWANRRLVTYIF